MDAEWGHEPFHQPVKAGAGIFSCSSATTRWTWPPLGVDVCLAKPSEHHVAEPVLAAIKVPRCGRGRPRSRPRRVIADKGYDSNPLRQRMQQRRIDWIAPYRSNSVLHRYEDKRKLPRYRKRWKIE